ncbi:hypothetical protein [Sediminitomix flava]|uniref:Uncharacterized protein n=1 Tax=Sediminitomix flava TaxID=379075 RepID=A0A315Z5S8_SEDFL|nr:hypothetical protein [Sediminitomix flava]PWJ37926.1 hypothetical protein BC781_10861 [Sediminitomix flava]
MISKEEKLVLVERIVGSDTFKKAPSSSAMLRYLVEVNIEDRFLKEGIIDLEFFGGKPNEIRNNPRVRVNIYNLRKKLDAYYQNEGVSDVWKLQIDKGQYGLRFEKQMAETSTPKHIQIRPLVPYFLGMIPVFILAFFQLPNHPPKVWESFFESEQTTNLYIGDSFGFGGKTISGRNGWTRDFSVNSLEEYYQFVKENPNLAQKTKSSNYTYSTRMAEHASHDLSRLFTQFENDFEIKYASKSSFSDLKKDHSIYVGRLKDQKNFVYLFNEANPYFELNDRMITFSGHPILADTSLQLIQNKTETDYALVSRMKGPENTAQFFFFSDHDIGVMATVEYFTNLDSLTSFENRYLKEDDCFTAIYKVKGQERVNLAMEMVMVVPFTPF